MEDGGGASVESVEPEPEPEDDPHSNTSDAQHPSGSFENELGDDAVGEDESTMDPATEDGMEGLSTAELDTNDSEDSSSDSDSDDSLEQDDAALKNNLERMNYDGDDSLGPVHASQDLQLSSDSSSDSVSSPVTSDLNSTNKTDTIPSEGDETINCAVSTALAVHDDVEECRAPEGSQEPRTVNDWADALEAVCQEDAPVVVTPEQEHLQNRDEVSRTSLGSSEDSNVTFKPEKLEDRIQSTLDVTVEKSELVLSEESETDKPDDFKSSTTAQVSGTEITNQKGEGLEYSSVKQNTCPVNILKSEHVITNTNNGIDLSSESSLSGDEEERPVSDNLTESVNPVECPEPVNTLLPSDECGNISSSEALVVNSSTQEEVSCDVPPYNASVSEIDKTDVDTSVSEGDKSTLDSSISESEKAETSLSGNEVTGEVKVEEGIKVKCVEEENEGAESTVDTLKETADTCKEEIGVEGGKGTSFCSDEKRPVIDVSLEPVNEKDHEDNSGEDVDSDEDDSEDDESGEESSVKVNGEFNESMDCDETDSTSHQSRLALSRGPTGKPVIMSNALNAAWKKRFSSPSTQVKSETSEAHNQSASDAGSSITTTSDLSAVPTFIASDTAEGNSNESSSPSMSPQGSTFQGELFPEPLTFSTSQSPSVSQNSYVAPSPLSSQPPKKVIRVQHSEPRKRMNRVNKGLLQPRHPVRFPGMGANVTSSLPEYPQYLGLQPTVKFKCVRCGEKGFTSMMELKTHQYACLKNPEPPCIPHQASSRSESSTNFRITRKVYLCSACGTYYENWNLFLHMREVHKRHICLFCLGMFSQAEKLSLHLVSKHKVMEGHYTSPEEFKFSFKGSCFLMCCSCEKMFTEDNFTNHNCRKEGTICSVCGGHGAHMSTCSARNHLVNATKKSVTLPQQDKTARMSSVRTTGTTEVAPTMLPSPTPTVGKTIQPSHQSTNTSRIQQRHLPAPEGEDEFDASRYCQINFTDERYQSKQHNTGKPRQVLKVKIPTTPPKKLENLFAGTSVPPSSLTNVPVGTSPTINQEDPTFVSHERCTTLSTIMTNLERTINSVALGATGEAQEWERRKEEERRRIEEARLIYTDSEVESEDENNSIQRVSSHSSSSSEEEEVEGVGQVPLIQEQQPEFTEQAPQIIPDPENVIGGVEEQTVEPTSELPVPTSPPPPSPPPPPPSPPQLPPPPPPNTTAAAGAEVSEETDDSDSDKLSLVVDESAAGSGDENTVQDTPANKTSPTEDCGETLISNDVKSPESNLTTEQPPDETIVDKPSDGICLAGQDVPETDLALDKPMDIMKVQEILKECVRTLCYVCVYCSHAKRIAVNGKQLALHVLAEHRFVPSDGTVNDIPAGERLITRLKDALEPLQDTYFNTDSYDSTDKANSLPYDRSYECFHCHFYTRLHKELYIHNRKMHQKTILLCIMCKSNFYSYSELLCHLCPGIYIPQCNVYFRCCMCEVDSLPSAFRLMVHLRKRHHACDVCLESTEDQQKLSNHVWKHKLHHLCYRCGIAYRNKPDITKHLFWKHGTESVLCKKCLQKKWPHVYHFCIPPASFVCEECSVSFSRAVSLRVHKRLHSGDFRYHCTECEDKFICKKLLMKHEERHRTPAQPQMQPHDVEKDQENVTSQAESLTSIGYNTKEPQHPTNKQDVQEQDQETTRIGNTSPSERKHSSKKKKHKREEEKKEKEEEKEQKKAVDVFDLPPLNLSSESDSSDEEEKKETGPTSATEQAQSLPPASPPPINEDRMEVEEPAPIVDGIWDKFQNYTASLEKRDSVEDTETLIRKSIMMDHDYCIVSEKPPNAADQESSEIKVENTDDVPKPVSLDEDETKTPNSSPVKKKKSPKKRVRQNSGRQSSSSSSDSSSDSDSSSCSCGTNCSCSSSSSSSSGSSSSSSDSEDSSSSEGGRRSAKRREQRREKAEAKKKKEEEEAASETPSTVPIDSDKVAHSSVPTVVEEPHIDVMESEPTIRESDLDTTETDTDEDFYDDNPQKLANELLQEKRNLMLLATVAPINNGGLSPAQSQSSQPSFTTTLEPVTGKKKSKKRRKKQAEEALAKREGAQQLLTLQDSGQMYEQQTYQHPYQQQQHLYESEQQNTSEVEHDPSTSVYPTSLYFTPKTPAPATVTTPALTSFSQPGSTKMKKPHIAKVRDLSAQNSGSETEGRTKRKRMPNRFYGYSSDEEDENNQQPATKWRKSTPSTSYQATIIPPEKPPMPTFTIKRSMLQQPPEPVYESSQTQVTWTAHSVPAPKSDSDSNSGTEQANGSSSSDSDSDDDAMQIAESPTPQYNTVRTAENKVNLYCYCQCPYDEVSEMIACDGEDCKIEWFHFECVGIMVPPKGQWYCPDCRRRMDEGLNYMLN